jgi:glycosyltransferase involved in cell wall biosynthesis
MGPSPRVSVVIPAYNRVDYLPEAIESVLAQTVDCWDLVVVDDGSEAEIREAIAPYLADRRISCHRQANAGRSRARNHGASLASGELLCFLDDDDRYVPDGLESLLSGFDSASEIGTVVGGYDFIDERGDVRGTRRPWEEEDGTLDLEGWLIKGQAIPASAMIRRAWFDRVGGFDPAYETGEDRDLFVRLAFAGCAMAWVQRTVCRYRRHGANTDARTQRDALLGVLARAFRDPRVPASARQREPQARSNVYLYTARRAAEAGDVGLVRENLAELARSAAEPAWRRQGMLLSPQGFPARIQLLAGDIAERCTREGTDVEAELEHAARAWHLEPRELRRALAHREIRAFFAALRAGDLEAAAVHRRAALRLDRRWLAHRTVLLFPVRLLPSPWSRRPLGSAP